MPETVILRELQRFLDQPPTDCWIWTGPSYGQGYGGVRIETWTERKAPRAAYRVMYELFRGPIPEGFAIDHLCRVRKCVNPAHLEAVTCRENLRRGDGFIGVQMRRTQCPRGHPLVAPNLVYNHGHKQCRRCTLDRARARYHNKRNDPEWYARYLARGREWKRRWRHSNS